MCFSDRINSSEKIKICYAMKLVSIICNAQVGTIWLWSRYRHFYCYKLDRNLETENEHNKNNFIYVWKYIRLMHKMCRIVQLGTYLICAGAFYDLYNYIDIQVIN